MAGVSSPMTFTAWKYFNQWSKRGVVTRLVLRAYNFCRATPSGKR